MYSSIAYSVIFWGSASISLAIFKLQKKAVRIIAGKPRKAPSRPLFRELNLLPLPCIYILVLTLYIKNNIGDYSLNSEHHQYHTRGRHNLHYGCIRTKAAKIGPKEMGLRLFNKLPKSIRESHGNTDFKKKLKRYLSHNMFYSIEEYFNSTCTEINTVNTNSCV
jgi:hypothetical protein